MSSLNLELKTPRGLLNTDLIPVVTPATGPGSSPDRTAVIAGSDVLNTVAQAQAAANAADADAAAGAASATAAAGSATAAAASANSAATSAALGSVGRFAIYSTKAAADAAFAGIPADALVDVFADETRAGQRTTYRKTGGSLVWQYTYPGQMTADGSLVVAQLDGNKPAFATLAPANSGIGVAGTLRSYINGFGAFYTQAWAVISGIFRETAPGQPLDIVHAGAYISSLNRYFANRVNGSTGGMLELSNDIVGPNLLFQDNGLSAGGLNATNIFPVAGGTGYTVGDILTLSGGTTQPRSSTLIATAGQTIFRPTVAAALAGDVVVTRLRAGVTTTLTQGTAYTLSTLGASTGVTVTLAAGALAGDQYTVTVSNGGFQASHSAGFGLCVANGGSGYLVNDTFTVDGGDPVSGGRMAGRVVSVGAGGAITAWEATACGDYRAYPRAQSSTTITNVTGTGTGARVIPAWRMGGRTRVVVTRVDTGGIVREVRGLDSGLYTVAPADVAAVTGGTGTGCTIHADWTGSAQASRYQDYLGGDGQMLASVEARSAAGFCWQFSAPDLNGDRTTHVMSDMTFGVIGDGLNGNAALGTLGRLRAEKGFWSPADSGFVLGHSRGLSMSRTLGTGAQDTVALGRIKFAGGPAVLQITAMRTGAGRTAVASWQVPLVWQIDQIDGGADLGANWAQVVPVFSGQEGGRQFALDLQVDASLGDVAFRLRSLATAGSAEPFDVQINYMAASSGEAGLLDPGAAWRRFEPSSATAAGVTAPTRLMDFRPRLGAIRVNYQSATPATGATVQIDQGVGVLKLNPAGTLAALTVALPTGPLDGQTVEVATTQTITTLTVTASGAVVNNGGVSATLTAGTRRTYTYVAASFAWVIG